MEPPPAVPLPGAEPPTEPTGSARGGAAEGALVERARRGDPEAFRVLVDQHRDRAYGLALRITRCREEAEDAAQDAFVRAWRGLAAFRSESSFGTWLHRIVVRRALDRVAARRTRQAREAELDDTEALLAPAGQAGGDVLAARRLEELMERLSAPQRAVLTLFYAEERSVEEIAAALEIPENTVKTHLFRGRAALREAWPRPEDGAP